MADKQISQLVAATTINNDDLFVMQQGGTAKKLSGQKLSDFVYQSAADQIERVDEAVEQAQAAVDSLEEQKNEIAQTIASMAELGTDITLSTPGMAADAAATGEVKDIALARFEQAEITGVPIATFDDGAENVPLKKLVVDVDPVQDLHGYSNPWPAGGGKNISPYPYYTSDGTIAGVPVTTSTDGKITATGTTNAEFFFYLTYSMSLKAGTYTISVQGNHTGVLLVLRDIANSEDLCSIASGTSNASSTITVESDLADVRLYMYAASSGTSITLSCYVQIESGSFATTYEPYSNICPITGWTGANIMFVGSDNIFDGEVESGYINVDTGANADSNSRYRCKNYIPVRPNTAYYYKASTYALANTALTRFYFFDQNKNLISTPSGATSSRSFTTPNNCFYFRFWVNTAVSNFDNTISINYPSTNTSYKAYVAGNTYPITFPSEAGTVYGGTLDVTNGKLTVDRVKAILTGDLITNISEASTGATVIRFNNTLTPTPRIEVSSKNISNMYTYFKNHVAYISECPCLRLETYTVFLYDMAYSGYTLEQVQEAFNTQNLEIVYEIEPVVYDLTPTEVRTLLSLNNIWADTGYVLDLIYRKMPIPAEELENTLESMIAGVEETMEATRNYTSGKLVVAAHGLYKTTTNIASGETLELGENCEATTIAAELEALSSVVTTGFASLGNLANLTYEVVT